MASLSPAYCLDTNLFLTAWNQTYRPVTFQSFWDKLSVLVLSGKAIIPEEVKRELSKKDDDVHAWVAAHAAGVYPLDEDQILIARELAVEFPALAKERLGRMRADGFVIALAKHKGIAVVTAENHRGAEKIPNICGQKGIECMALADMIEREGWRF